MLDMLKKIGEPACSFSLAGRVPEAQLVSVDLFCFSLLFFFIFFPFSPVLPQ
jgi:hypothetical protein